MSTPTTTSSESAPDAAVQVLIAAYRVLDLELRASPVAIEYSYRELLQLNQPDRCPGGSPEQQRASERRQAIEAAFQLIQDAPLRDHPLAHQTEPGLPLQPPDHGLAIDRPVSVATETIVRFVLGAVVGLVLADSLRRRGVPGFSVYLWGVPLVMGILFMSSERPLFGGREF